MAMMRNLQTQLIFLWWLACVLGVTTSGCATSRPIEARSAQAQVAAAWQANQHTVWDLTWPAAPTGGPLTVETWQADGRYRYEILESTAPALIGETLVSDGQAAYRYNRLALPDGFAPVVAGLSPVSDAFALISARLAQPATAAAEQPAQLEGRRVRLIGLSFADGARLMAWLDSGSGLLAQLDLSGSDQSMRLHARTTDPLPEPPPELFTVGAWASNQE